MKTFRTSIIALLLLAAISCKKDGSSASASLTSDQAADLAAGALASNSNGVASMTDAVSANAQTVASVSSGQTVNAVGVTSEKQACGTTRSDSTTNAGSADSVTWSYFVKYTHTLNCSSTEQPDNIINTLIFNGNYSGPNLTHSGSGSANATIAGLSPTAANFVLNGEYKRSGEFSSKVGNKASGNSNIDIVLTNVTLSKPGRKITGGTGTIAVSGTSKKGSFSFSGTITFNSDGTATLDITGGSSYTIDLHSGFRFKKH